ncbi:endolytic transglycosylase MltG [Streptomyces xiaopingdaonensis]|uniref:endolytic transglycosylase MltG n=1 Tax=Streptomyces xiaopingdaonensis TaxID=1565415 RepID=UPI0002F6982F|nr:endolytic transglycosylase MltG [Streptomyces xiaopingdaonensis]
MTEYGRGPESQPWDPDDPLYGDGQFGAGYPGDYRQGWQQAPYGTEGHYSGYPSYQPQQPYPLQYQVPQQYDPYPTDPANPGQYQGGWPQGVPYDQQYGAQYPAQHPGDPYGTGEHPAYYPEQQQQQQQQQHQYQHPEPGYPQPDPDTGWDPGPDQGESAFFGGRDEEAEAEDDGEVPRGGKKRKRRGGCACFVVSLLVVGGIGTVGYFGWGFYQARFASAPDYEGDGAGEIQVEIPDGAVLSDMGRLLTKEDVVKSSGAFVEAAEADEKAQAIQPGTYTLRKRMSGEAAVAMMLDPQSQNGFIVAEGLRASKIYQLVDEKLEVSKGTTKKAANSGDIGLPSWAEGKPEGFLFPSKYSVGRNTDPEDLLRQMVKRAEAEYEKVGLTKEAKRVDRSPREVITIASLIQAEAQQDHEFGKVSRVIHNRLDEPMALGFDSTINYALGRSTLNTTVQDTRYPSPYNTYLHRGLPPGPICNPGHQAIEAALKPTKGNWLYFVTVKAGDTRFTDSKSEHDRNVQDFNEEQRKERENGD